jgi:hypothetical protein
MARSERPKRVMAGLDMMSLKRTHWTYRCNFLSAIINNSLLLRYAHCRSPVNCLPITFGKLEVRQLGR